MISILKKGNAVFLDMNCSKILVRKIARKSLWLQSLLSLLDFIRPTCCGSVCRHRLASEPKATTTRTGINQSINQCITSHHIPLAAGAVVVVVVLLRSGTASFWMPPTTAPCWVAAGRHGNRLLFIGIRIRSIGNLVRIDLGMLARLMAGLGCFPSMYVLGGCVCVCLWRSQ